VGVRATRPCKPSHEKILYCESRRGVDVVQQKDSRDDELYVLGGSVPYLGCRDDGAALVVGRGPPRPHQNATGILDALWLGRSCTPPGALGAPASRRATQPVGRNLVVQLCVRVHALLGEHSVARICKGVTAEFHVGLGVGYQLVEKDHRPVLARFVYRWVVGLENYVYNALPASLRWALAAVHRYITTTLIRSMLAVVRRTIASILLSSALALACHSGTPTFPRLTLALTLPVRTGTLLHPTIADVCPGGCTDRLISAHCIKQVLDAL